MKKALVLFMLLMLFVPPLWGIRRIRRVLRMPVDQQPRAETGE